jgi:methylmalonyl-CoA mutase
MESPRIYAPDDGRSMGLQGMINDLVEQSDFPTGNKLTDEVAQLASKTYRNCKSDIGSRELFRKWLTSVSIIKINEIAKHQYWELPGTGAGKSSLVDDLVKSVVTDF